MPCCQGWSLCPNVLLPLTLFSGSQLGATVPSPWDIWQCLETFLVVTTTGVGATGTKLIETRDAAQDPTVHGTAARCPTPTKISGVEAEQP